MNRDLLRRLSRIERDHVQEFPTRILSDRALDDGQAEDFLANWRHHVASRAASLSGSTLCIMSPVMTVAEWEAAYCQEPTLH